MLVNSGSAFDKGDIITIKNILGEEIICTFVEEDATTITISDPWAVASQAGGIGLVPPMVTGEFPKGKEFPVQRAHILWVGLSFEKHTPGLLATYRKEVTGIEVVESSKKIIT